MSKRTRDAYFALQNKLLEKITTAAEHLDRELSHAEFEKIRETGSLRTATAVDVGSRNKTISR